MPTPPPRSLILDDTNGNGEFDEGDDLKEDIKITLGAYLSELTKTPPTQNAYEIAAELEDSPSFNQVTDKTAPIVTGKGSGEPTYIDDVTEAAKVYFETIGDGDFGHGDDPLLGLIDKALRAAKHGEVLGSITGDGESDVEQKVSAILKNNRFNPGGDSPFIQNGERSKSFGRTQKVMGEYVTDNGDSSKVQSYEVEDLQKIAFSLLLKASGRLQADDDPTEFDAGSVLTTTGGEGVQLATVRVGNEKLGAGDLEARNAYRGRVLTKNDTVDAELRDPEIPAKAGFFDFDTPGASYGQMYSHLENFSPFGPYSPSPIALLFPQFVTIAASTAAVGLLVGLLTGDLGFPKKDLLNPGEDVLPMGSSRQSATMFGAFQSFMKKLLQVPETTAPFLPSVFVGLLWFQVGALFGAAGLITSVQRGVARDTVTFMDMLANDELFSGGLISNLNAIGIIIDSLLNSKFYRFTIIMAILGDKIITGSWKKSKTFNYGLGKANLDELPNNALYRVAKSRKADDEKGLVWAAGNIPSTYILPSAFVTAQQVGTVAGLGTSLSDFLSNASLNMKFVDPSQFTDQDGNPGKRLPGALVEAIENQLEIEYVPFYFHDLRTNEIIAFHAFLQNLSDSYSANWNAQTGIGRVEPAYIYGGTTRAISMQFLIAATSPDDYDEMWYKINKLTTLVYPQFSRGRVLTDGTINFVQPFSQVQTASPLVRIRLGDLFKSNYSKFSLARLFGLGQAEDVFKPSAEGGSSTDEEANAEKIAAAAKTVFDSRDPSNKEALGYITGDQVVILPVAGGGFNVAPVVPGAGATKNNMTMLGPIRGTIGIPILVSPPDEDDGAGNAARLAATTTPAAGDAATAEGTKIKSSTKYAVILDQTSNDLINDKLEPLVPGDYIATVPMKALKLQPAWANTLINLEAGLIPSLFPADPAPEAEFFDSANNAIVRSFESARGRGLAGAITSLDFDWNEKPWRTDIPGSKAPLFCAVTINFSPVHDITPGLDSDGFNRAPVYNVGKVMNAIGGDPYGMPPSVNESIQAEMDLQQGYEGTTLQTMIDTVKEES